MPTDEALSPKVSTTARPKRPSQPALSEILTPGFRTAAAFAGWDEESILLASLIVGDTPVRESRCKKRSNPHLTSPRSGSSSTRKRRSARLAAPEAIPPISLCLDEDDDKERGVLCVEEKGEGSEESSTACGDGVSDVGGVEEKGKGSRDSAEKDSGKGLECMDRLREELRGDDSDNQDHRLRRGGSCGLGGEDCSGRGGATSRSSISDEEENAGLEVRRSKKIFCPLGPPDLGGQQC